MPHGIKAKSSLLSPSLLSPAQQIHMINFHIIYFGAAVGAPFKEWIHEIFIVMKMILLFKKYDFEIFTIFNFDLSHLGRITLILLIYSPVSVLKFDKKSI
jgi:hypothetical protein